MNFILGRSTSLVSKGRQCPCRALRTNRAFARSMFCDASRWEEELTDDTKIQIEKHWHERVVSDGQSKEFRASFDAKEKKKFYVLAMFPYPSGKLHMGHVRVYSISDAIARFYRLSGKEVIHPMGWDAFGLPAENAAIERGEDPASWTYRNIAIMKEQLLELGCSFDWTKEFATCDPKYYKWTQYLFLKLYEHGLAYQNKAFVNWDPVDKTVLADEQVDENGHSWRSGAKVEKRPLKQWFLRSTHFSESLCNGLQNPVLDNWREVVKIQKHWIGDCNGCYFHFQIKEGDSLREDSLGVWTDKPEFFYGVTFIALSPTHILSKSCSTASNENCNQDILLNVVAKHPFTKKDIPIFVSSSINYPAKAEAYLGIPGEIDEDQAFANMHRLPSIKLVRSVQDGDTEKTVLQESGEFSGMTLDEAKRGILDKAKKMRIGGHLSSSHLRDWLISRQRYWGTPIPIIHCDKCKEVPVPYGDLPVELPKNKNASDPEYKLWSDVSCPKCGEKACRETDTMDTFVDSSWYFLRFLDPHNCEAPFDRAVVDKAMPVDFYIGGKEHADVHLYYARFMNHFCHSIGMVGHQEPFKRLLVQGMVLGETFCVRDTGKFLPKDQVSGEGNNLVETATNAKVDVHWEKMSKSRFNGVDPKDVLNKYGIDTTRLFMLADFSPVSPRKWSSSTFPGILRWQHRLWLTVSEFRKYRHHLPEKKRVQDEEAFKKEEDFLWESRNFHIKQITHYFMRTYQLSVAISNQQSFTNFIRRTSPATVSRSPQYEMTLAAQIIMLAPLAPHFACELWAGFVEAAEKTSADIFWDADVLSQAWPVMDKNYNLNLNFKINNVDISVTKLTQSQLESLTEIEALKLVEHNPEIRKYINLQDLPKYFFNVTPGYEAELEFIIHDSDIKTKKKKK